MLSVFCPAVLEYYSAVWSAADTHIKLLDRAVSGARFLTGDVFECDIAHRRSVAVLCMLYMIRCNPMHLLNGALPGQYVPVRVTFGALVAHQYTYAPPRCKPRSIAWLLFPSWCPSGMILLTPYSMVWDWRVSWEGQRFFIGLSCSIGTIVFYSFSLSLLSVCRLVLWGWGLRTDMVYIYITLLALHCRSLLIIIIIIRGRYCSEVSRVCTGKRGRSYCEVCKVCTEKRWRSSSEVLQRWAACLK